METESRKGRSIAGVHGPRAQTHDWITPKFIIDHLGPFDLDPCQCHTQPWPCAAQGIVLPEDGLSRQWHGRVWLNPPYNTHAAAWLAKLARHGCGTALIFARTETEMFFAHVWRAAHAVLFLEGRLNFHFPDGRRADHNSGGPSCLIAYGEMDQERLRTSSLKGHFVQIEKRADTPTPHQPIVRQLKEPEMITLTLREARELEGIVERLLFGHEDTGGGMHVMGDNEFRRLAHLALSDLRGRVHEARWPSTPGKSAAVPAGSPPGPAPG